MAWVLGPTRRKGRHRFLLPEKEAGGCRRWQDGGWMVYTRGSAPKHKSSCCQLQRWCDGDQIVWWEEMFSSIATQVPRAHGRPMVGTRSARMVPRHSCGSSGRVCMGWRQVRSRLRLEQASDSTSQRCCNVRWSHRSMERMLMDMSYAFRGATYHRFSRSSFFSTLYSLKEMGIVSKRTIVRCHGFHFGFMSCSIWLPTYAGVVSAAWVIVVSLNTVWCVVATVCLWQLLFMY